MVTRDEVRRAYDALATAYGNERSGDGRGMEILSAFLDGCPEGAAVLDAGCGPGAPVLERLASPYSVVGLDVSRSQLQVAADTAPGAALVQGDMTALPFAHDAFDAVVAFWSLIHVPLADHATVIEEFARVLRPGGRALVCEGPEEWVGENPDWLETGVRMAWEIAGAEATREQLRDAGFALERTWGADETLADGADGDDPGDDSTGDADGDDEDDWIFFAARLQPDV